MEYIKSTQSDGNKLAEIRAAAMKPSLEAIRRFDENRVRSRFLESFVPDETFKIVYDNEVVGFYVVRDKGDHIYLDHLYVEPSFQNMKIGKSVIDKVKKDATQRGLPVRLGALRGSKSNDFYKQNGFIKTNEDEFDLYYEYRGGN
ncbi:GNAT family N-acetyltransferase [Celerinatantimonas yamalensis]|uniref:GNAT family N-acetyltransferase n=1 Tax=Celerinatantimonas yamalensis TaxID=559956 RepID=A0ABW9GDA6_9GAMM